MHESRSQLRRHHCVLLLVLVVHCGARSGLRQPDVTTADVRDAVAPGDVLDARDTEDAADVRDDRDTAPPPDCRDVPSLCDDGNVCSIDSCTPAGTCVHDSMRCEDDDPCTMNTCHPRLGCMFPVTECGGCADGQREAFRDMTRHPDIAGCSGGFAFPGLASVESPMCGRVAGDDGTNPGGTGCTAADLCAPTWHVCRSAADVAAHSPDGCAGARDAPMNTFFATRQTGPGCLECATGVAPGCGNDSCRSDCAPGPNVTNDIFGCGNAGSTPRGSCFPLDRSGNNLCGSLPFPWRCNDGATASVHESDVVVKPGAGGGGVLCCRD